MNNNTFNYEDLATMSDGIIALIDKASQAQKLVCDNKSHEAIEEYITRLKGLNTRICHEMENIQFESYNGKGYGYGEIKYKTLDDFPDDIIYKGKRWYYNYKKGKIGRTRNTGILAVEYWADPEDDSKRIWMDATGNIQED